MKTVAAPLPQAMTVNGIVVRCYELESGVFRAEVQHAGGRLVDDLSQSYPTEAQARHHARTAATLFAAGWSVAEVIALVSAFQVSPPSGAASEAAGWRGQLPPCEEEGGQ